MHYDRSSRLCAHIFGSLRINGKALGGYIYNYYPRNSPLTLLYEFETHCCVRVRATSSFFTIYAMTLHVKFAGFFLAAQDITDFVVAGKESDAFNGRVEVGQGPTTLVPTHSLGMSVINTQTPLTISNYYFYV